MNVKLILFGLIMCIVACTPSQPSTDAATTQLTPVKEWNRESLVYAYSITSDNCYKTNDTTAVYAKLLSMVIDQGTMLIIPDIDCDDIENISMVIDDEIHGMYKNIDRRHMENTFFVRYEDFSKQKNTGFMFQQLLTGKCTTILFNDDLTSEIDKAKNISIAIPFKPEVFTFTFNIDKNLQSVKNN